jgi:tRNA(Ile2) C34 agmatinyltransferase TiaS
MVKEKEVIIKGKDCRIIITQKQQPKIEFYNENGTLAFELVVDRHYKQLLLTIHQCFKDYEIVPEQSTTETQLMDFRGKSFIGLGVKSNEICPQCGTNLLIDISTLNSGVYYCPKCSYSRKI